MKKKFGFGSLSLILFVLAIVWSANIKGLNSFCLGDAVLNFANLPAWSNENNLGTHYTIFYSIIFLIPATIVGIKYPNYIFAKFGKNASIVYLSILFLSSFFMI